MSFLSRDRQTVLGAGRWMLCTECGEGTHVNDSVLRHAAGCSRTPIMAVESEPTQPCRDPHLYVWTRSGIERLMDVEARVRGA